MPAETEFANAFEDAQLDLERREKNLNGEKRSMKMWRNAIEHVWNKRSQREVHKLFNRQPRIQRTIIDQEGERTQC